MSTKIKISLMFILCVYAIAISTAYTLESKPYIGADYQLNRMGFKNRYGNNLFPKNYPQINIYAGLKFDKHKKIESGYVSTFSKTKYSNLSTGEVAGGMAIDPRISPALFKNYIKINGPHLSFINTFYPTSNESFRLLAGIGAAFLRAEAYRNALSFGRPPVKGNIRKFKKHKAVLRIIVGYEYRFENKLGIRGSFCYLNTRRMVIKAEPISGRFTPIIKPKDSFVIGLGAFYDF